MACRQPGCSIVISRPFRIGAPSSSFTMSLHRSGEGSSSGVAFRRHGGSCTRPFSRARQRAVHSRRCQERSRARGGAQRPVPRRREYARLRARGAARQRALARGAGRDSYLPASHAALKAASRSLFFSLPVAFDPAESVGTVPRASVDRDAAGQPYRFLDMGALIATQAFGENDPAVVRAVLESLPFVDVALRAFRIPDRAVAAPQGRAEPHRAGRHAAPLRRQHRRRGGRERDQVRAA